MRLRSSFVRPLHLPLLALLALGCGPDAEPCTGDACPRPLPTGSFDPCGSSYTCGWEGFGLEGLAVPTAPQRSEVLRVGEQLYARSFAFQARAGHTYTFTCRAEGFDACAVQLSGFGYAEPPFLEQVGRTTYAHSRAGFDQAYQVTVKALPEGSAGAFEYALAERSDDHPDAPAAEARVPTDGTPLPGQLDVGPDTDAFAFEAQAGHLYRVRCEGSFGAGVRFALSDPTGAFVSGAAVAQPALGQQTVAARSGRHVFLLTADATPQAVPYTCRVEDRGPDDHGNSVAAATRLAPGPAPVIAGELELAYDRDFFAFEARAGHAYTLRCGPAAQEVCATTYVVDAQGRGLGLPAGSAQDALLFVSVGASGSWTGAYSLVLEDLGPDEGSGAQDAVALEAGAPRAGHLLRGGDEDFFRLEAQAQRVYRVRADTKAVEASLLADPSHSLTRYDRGSPGKLFKVSADASVLLRVSGEPGTYGLLVEPLGLDDHADAPGGATAVDATLSARGQLDTSTDVDWFSVQLQQRPYRLQPTARDTQLLLFEADGVTPVPWDSAAGAWVPRADGPHLVRADMFGYFTAQDAYSFSLLPL